MTKGNVYDLYKTLLQLKDYGNVKFKYAILKNIEMLKPHYNSLTTLEENNRETVAEFEKERNNLIMQLGKPEQDGTIHVTDDNMQEYSEKLQGLIEKYQQDITKYGELMEEFNEILKEDFDEDINLRQIKLDACPDNLTSKDLELLLMCNMIIE
jgi:hypothetical protein